MEEDMTDTSSTNPSKAGCQEMSQGHDWVLRDRRIHYQYLSIHLLQQEDKRKIYLPESVLDYKPILNSTQGMDR